MTNYQTMCNPSAVLGASVANFRMERSGGGCFQGARDTPRSGKYSGLLHCPDAAVLLRLRSSTALGAYLRTSMADSWCFTGLPLEVALQAAAVLRQAGFGCDDGLFAEQVEAELRGGATPDQQRAYDDFVVLADQVLTEVQQLGVPALQGAKGIRDAESPSRGRILRSGQRGVLVFPDCYEAKYVHVQLMSPSEALMRQVRNIAGDILIAAGLRPHIGII